MNYHTHLTYEYMDSPLVVFLLENLWNFANPFFLKFLGLKLHCTGKFVFSFYTAK